MSTLVFAISLLAVAAALIAWHLLAWRKADHGGLTDEDYRFYRSQFRRRMQTSALLGVMGLLALGDLWITGTVARAALWSVMFLLLVWVLLLAAADWLASRLHFDKLLSASAVEHELLKREIEQFHREKNAGTSPDS
jgi:small-conductance mechanosensitive channel